MNRPDGTVEVVPYDPTWPPTSTFVASSSPAVDTLMGEARAWARPGQASGAGTRAGRKRK